VRRQHKKGHYGGQQVIDITINIQIQKKICTRQECKAFGGRTLAGVLSNKADDADLSLVKDLNGYPELQLLERYHYIPPLLVIAVCYGIGVLLSTNFPHVAHITASDGGMGCFFSVLYFFITELS
jgi:hypothetical protein